MLGESYLMINILILSFYFLFEWFKIFLIKANLKILDK